MLNDTPKLTSISLAIKPTVKTFLLAGVFSAVSMSAYTHPKQSDTDSTLERAEKMTDKRSLIRAKSQERREQAKKRAATARQEANERRELHNQKTALRRIEREKEQEKYHAFKADLVKMLKDDGVVNSEHEAIRVIYVDGHPILNDIDLSARFGDKYENLWAAHDRLISNNSYINIMAGSYEIREIKDDGSSYYFVMQN